ncbi:hypothetical protein [Cytobacillus firmus]|uniref:hypothetical protein n=1 Tax=Cytobacillus firmus TaxID=1399 RepID=UPI0018CFBAA0|nr:hypothetical protein [Cytobacillus firmus]MBG9589530.1 hypothetical protein [Cytobacillus firmus]
MAVLDKQLIPIIGKKKYFSLLARMELQEMLDHNKTVKSAGEGKKISQKKMLERINAMRKKNDEVPYTLYWLKKTINQL